MDTNPFSCVFVFFFISLQKMSGAKVDFLMTDPPSPALWYPPAPVPQKGNNKSTTTIPESNDELVKRAARAYVTLSRNDADITGLTSVATEYANALYGLTYYYGSTSTKTGTALVAKRAAEWTLSAMDYYKLAAVAISGVLDRDAPAMFNVQSRVLGSPLPTVKDCVAFQQAYKDIYKNSIGTLAPLMQQYMHYWQGRAAVCLARDHYYGQGNSGSEVTKVDKVLARRYIAYAAMRFKESLPLGKDWQLYAIGAEQRVTQELARNNLSLGVPRMIPSPKEDVAVTFPTPTEWPPWPASQVEQFDRYLQVQIDTYNSESTAAKIIVTTTAPKSPELVLDYLLGVKQQPRGISMDAWYWMTLAAARTALADREVLLSSTLVTGVPGVRDQLIQVRDVLRSLDSKINRVVH
jgi:hypothetical protein